MAEEELSNISIGQFETVYELVASSESLQIAFAILFVGLIIIGIIYHKFSHWVLSKKFNYSRPHVSRFIRKAVLPLASLPGGESADRNSFHEAGTTHQPSMRDLGTVQKSKARLDRVG